MTEIFFPLVTALSEPFLLPVSRTYWLGLVMFCMIAIAYYWLKKPDWNKAGFWSVIKHPSSILDMQLFAGRQLLRAILGTPIWFTAWLVATKGVRWLDANLGAPEPPFYTPELIAIVYSLTLFVVWDFSRFFVHWLMHRVSFLWSFHQIHHSAEVLTPLTFHRIHPVESWIYEFRSVVVTGVTSGMFYWVFRENISQLTLFGVPAMAFMLNIITGNLRHSHLWIPYPPFLERWFISPAQHQIHHGLQADCFDRNYGTWLAIWDRMIGSLALSASPPDSYGVAKEERNHDYNLLSAWFGPFIRLIPFSMLLLCLVVLPVSAEEDNDDEEDNDEQQFDEQIIIYGDDQSIQVAGSAHRVSEEELTLFELDNIEGILLQVPGVVTRGEDGFGLRPNIGIRGANSDRSAKITLMEDGILLAPAPYAAPAAYYFPMSTRMVGIEVFKGAAATRHGPQTVGGALNLLTRDIPTENHVYTDVSAGLRNSYKVHGWTGARNDRAGFILEGVHLRSDGFKELDSGGETGFERSEMMLKSDLRFSNQVVELKLGYANETSRETYLGLTQKDLENNPYRRYPATELGLMKWNRTQAHASWSAKPTDNLKIRTVVYHHYLDRAWRKFNKFSDGTDTHRLLQLDPTSGQGSVYLAILRGEEDSTSAGQVLQIGTNDRQFHNAGLQSALRWEMASENLSSTLDAGLRFHGDHVTRVHSEEPYNMVAGGLEPSGGETVTNLDSVATSKAVAVYFYEDLRYKKIHVYPSSRIEVVNGQREDNGELGDSITRTTYLPGFGTLFNLSDWTDVFGSVHRGFSPVSPGQPAEVQPELSWNYEAGLRLNEGQVYAEAIGFFNNYSNITGQCSMSGGCDGDDIDRQYNGGKVWIYGLESIAGKRFLLANGLELPIDTTYTLTKSNFQTDFYSSFPQFGSVSIGDSLPYLAVHQARFSGGIEAEKIKFAVELSYRSQMLDQAGSFEDETIPSLFLINAALNASISKQWSLYATGTNLSNSNTIVSWRPYGARPVAPLQVMFGVKWNGSG